MKLPFTLRSLVIALAMLAGVPAMVHAQLIDVNFNTNSLYVTGGGYLHGPAMTGAAVLGKAGDQWNGIEVCSNSTGIPLIYANGSNSPVTMTFTSAGGYNVYGYSGSTPFTGTTYVALMENYLYNGRLGVFTNQIITLSGLTPNSYYNLVLYNAADTAAAGRTTYFTVNGITQSSTWNGSSSTLIAGIDYVEFASVFSDGSGKLVIGWNGNGSAEGDINGFQIIQTPLIDVDFNNDSYGAGNGGPTTGPTMSGAAVLGAPGDQWNGIAVSNGTAIPLIYANGSSSPVTMTFASGGGNDAYSYNGNTPFTGTPYVNLMQDYLFTVGAQQTITLSGLAANSFYNLVLYNAADVAAAGRTTSFVVNGTTLSSTWNASSSTLIAGIDYVDFPWALSDASGNMVIAWNGNGGGEGDIDGFQIQLSHDPLPETNIVWSDEFNGTSLNTNNWTFDIGNGFESGGNYVPGWGNNELEYYTSRTNNVYVAGGYLHIHAQQESYDGFDYTSARLKSLGLFSKAYGRFEWRAQLPSGTGLWPALWMLPENSPYGGWPNSGEIDVMENNGADPGYEGATIHYGGANGDDVYSSANYYFTSPDSVTNWHTYDLLWNTNSIQFLVDGNLFETQSNWYANVGTSTSTYPYPAPFNTPFYILMNMAIGGNYLGNPTTDEINPSLPAEVLVDYVRVYDLTPPLLIYFEPQSGGSLQLSWSTNIACHLQSSSSVNGNWSDVPGGNISPFVVIPNPSQGTAFYRLESP